MISQYREMDAPLLPILHALQDEFGYIDEAAEPLLAAALNRSRAEIHGVVTFYHDFRHASGGRHVLKLCRAEACQAAGGDRLAARAEAEGIDLRATAVTSFGAFPPGMRTPPTTRSASRTAVAMVSLSEARGVIRPRKTSSR